LVVCVWLPSVSASVLPSVSENKSSSGDDLPERDIALFCYPSCV